MNLAQLIDAVPVVQSTADRNARYATPTIDQRVYNKGTGNIERWNGAWVTDFVGIASVNSAPHGDTNYANGDGTPGGKLLVYSQIASYGAPAAGGADLVLVAPKHRSGGIDYDIHLVAEKVAGILGTGVVFPDIDFKVSEYLQAPFRGHGFRILQQDNSSLIEFPFAGGVIDLDAKIRGRSSGKNVVFRLGTALGFFIVESSGGAGNLLSMDNTGSLTLASGIYSGFGAIGTPVATKYRVPVCLLQSGNFTTTSTGDASITSFNLLGGSLGTAFSAVHLRCGGREVTQNGSFNIKFGATVIATVVPLAGESWSVDLKVTRIGGSAQRVTGWTLHNATIAAVTAQPNETLANDILIDFRGSVTAGGTLAMDDVEIIGKSSI